MKKYKKKRAHLFSVFITILFGILGSFFLPPAHAQAFKRLGIGEEAFEISLKDMNGANLSLSNYKNKSTVALVFFKYPSLRGATCLSYWQKMYDTYKSTYDFEVLAVYCPQTDKTVTDEEIQAVNKIITDYKISYPIVIDSGLTVFAKYGVITLPSSGILDKKGAVQYILPGFPEFGAERDIKINLKKALGIPEEVIVKKQEYIPKNKADFSYKLAIMVNERGNSDKAIEHLKSALTKDPDYADAWVTLAKLYVIEGKKNDAVEAFRKALTLEPNNIDALLSYGFLCMDLDKKDDALLQFKNILEVDKSKSAEGFYGQGTIYMQNQLFDSAKLKLEEAVKLYKDWKAFSVEEKMHFGMTYFNMGEIYVNLKDNKSAIENYQKSYQAYKELTEKLLNEKKNRAN